MKLRPRLTFALSVLLLGLAGCGTPSQPLPMVITPAEALQLRTWVPEVFKLQIAVAPVQGGEATWRWWGSKVSQDALQAALEDSLHAVGLRPLAPEPPARFELRTQLLSLEQPLAAAEVTVRAAVRYQLVERASGRLLFDRTLRSEERAGLSDALFSQPERLRIANERVLRANFALMLRELLALRP
jgi:hypothetical protein